jgi:hypothetical protein
MEHTMKKLGLFAVTVAMVAGCVVNDEVTDDVGAAQSVAPQASWEGRWGAIFSIGSGDGNVLVEYEIFVTGNEVTIDADGTQTQTRLNGRAERSGDDLIVKYDSCGSQLPNVQADCRQHEKGEVLAKLTKQGVVRSIVFGTLPFPIEKKAPLELVSKDLWEGTWKGAQVLGTDTGKIAEYSITVAGSQALIDVDGVQLRESVIVEKKLEGNDLVLTFSACADGTCAGLKAGDHVATLVREGKDTFLQLEKLEGIDPNKKKISLELQ